MIWERVSRQSPCPICGKFDWCQIGDYVVKCMRVESARMCTSGGWYHKNGSAPIPAPRRAPVHIESGPTIPAAELMERWRAQTPDSKYTWLAGHLGVSVDSLRNLGAAYAREHFAWAFPMRNGSGDVVGIRLRNDSGRKWAVRGSRSGIFHCNAISEPRPRIAYLPEGPTDSAALLSVGLYAVGRPSCQSGLVETREHLRRVGIFKAVIISDNDELKRTAQGSEFRPGMVGAMKLKSELGISSVIWIPPSPCKDVREFVRLGGTRAMIESSVNNKIWTKK